MSIAKQEYAQRRKELCEMMEANSIAILPSAKEQNRSRDTDFPFRQNSDFFYLSGFSEPESVLVLIPREADFDQRVMNWINSIRAKVRAGASPPGEFLDLNHFLHDMRLYKSDAEIDIMQKAAQISAEAHIKAMQRCKPGIHEYVLESEIRYHCGAQGGREMAYNSIVGGGDNACVLHYIENSAKLESGDLVLIDAGCEYEFYASDITRTFPVSGRFSPR